MKKVMILFSMLSLIMLVFTGCNNSDKVNAEKTALDFAREFYTVDSTKIDKYNALMKKNDDLQSFAETMHSNDEALKSLMTEDGYNSFVQNRFNLMFEQVCSLRGYTMEVIDVTLSKNAYDKDEKGKAGYNFVVNFKIISNKDKSEQTDTSNGYIGLVKENDKWKVFTFRMNTLPKMIQESFISQ